MNDYSSKKDRKRETAALALISSQTLSEAAQVAGISQTTLYRWRQEPAFLAVVARVKSEALTTASNNLAALSAGAVGVLQEIANSREAPPAQRVSAAKTLLELAFRLREQDEVITRIEVLERSVTQTEQMHPKANK